MCCLLHLILLYQEEFINAGFEICRPQCQPERCRLKVLFCVTDLPAKALLLHCQQYNGCFGCSECEIKGQVVPRLRGHTTSFWQQSLAIKRTHKSVCHQAQVALQTNKVGIACSEC